MWKIIIGLQIKIFFKKSEMREKEKKKRKKTPQNCKNPMQKQRFIIAIKM